MSHRLRRLVLSWVGRAVVTGLLVSCAPSPPPTPTAAPKPAATAPTPQAAPPAPPTAAPAAKPGPAGTPAAPTIAPAAKPGPAGAPPAPTAAPAKPAAKPAGPAEWVVAFPEEPIAVDPSAGATTTNASALVHQHIFDALITFEGRDFKLAPRLAESWNLVDDQTWIFKLRKGVKFHNGDEVTAADVKYSIETYQQDKSPRRYYTEPIASVDSVDPYTVKLTTRGVRPTMLISLAKLFIMPRAAREKAGEEGFARNPIGTGPYKFVEWVRGQRIVLEANPNYFLGQPNPKRLIIRPVLDPSTRVAELKTGGVHVALGPPVARLKEIASGDTELIQAKGARIIIYPFNTTKKPFDDPRVRQAVNYAIDREAIVKNVLTGYGVALHGPFGPGWFGYDPNLQPYAYDPAKAKQLLADAGYPNGLETVWNVTNGVFLQDKDIAEAVASQLGKVGIKVQLVPTERAKLLSDWTNGVFEGISAVSWGTSADPDPMLGYYFYQRKAHKPDEKLNSLIDLSRRTVDLEQRKKVLQDFGRYVHEQAYWMFIHAQDGFWGKRKDVPWEHYPINSDIEDVAYFQVPWK